MTEWTYYRASPGVEHGSGGILEGVLVVVVCAALELLVVAVAVGTVSLQPSLAMSKARRRHARRHRGRRVQQRLATLAELDAWLDSVWNTEVDARRHEAERVAARLIGSQTALIGVRCCRRTARECCAQLTFADGTTLALWSSSPACEGALRGLEQRAVLEWASPPDRGDLKFAADDHAVLINGDLLTAGAR